MLGLCVVMDPSSVFCCWFVLFSLLFTVLTILLKPRKSCNARILQCCNLDFLYLIPLFPFNSYSS